MESGEWRVESGEWRAESGEWRAESGEWRVESGEWRDWNINSSTQSDSVAYNHCCPTPHRKARDCTFFLYGSAALRVGLVEGEKPDKRPGALLGLTDASYRKKSVDQIHSFFKAVKTT